MSRTRNDSAHLDYLIRLTQAIRWVTAHPLLDQRAVRQHTATVYTLTADHTGDPTAYRAIAANIRIALAYLGRHAALCGFDHVRDDFCTLRDLANGYLKTLTREDRVYLAAFEGFRYAHLVEENTRPGGAGALVTWLNPVYDARTNPDLTRIQDAALRRYAERYPDLADIDPETTEPGDATVTVIFA